YTSSLLQFPSKGTANILGDSIVYQAGLYYQGNDTLRYLICSNLIPGYCDTAQVVYTMQKQVFAFDDMAGTLEDVSVNSAVKQNDTEFEPGQVTVLINPRHGSAFVGMNDSLRYTPSPDFFGLDSLRYALCTINQPRICDSAWLRLTVYGLNDAPIAAYDTASTYKNRFRDIPVIDNDKDPDGDPISITFVGQPNKGTAQLQGNEIRYTPERNFTGTDRFRYAICDNQGMCDSADVFINVLERTELVISSGLSPNMDGINEYWVVEGIELVNENEVIILNRWGSVVWKKTGYDNTWNGVNMQGEPLPEGTYFYVIRVPEEERVYKGFIVIQRD
ncbi:MAG: Ig-like domain-containing protein, partial [Bacteroidia bacterium]